MENRTFEKYWETEGSRQQVESHEERARRAWKAGVKELKKVLAIYDKVINSLPKEELIRFANALPVEYNRPKSPNANLCGMSFPADPWYLFVNKPPKSEDFEPTGWIHAIDDKENHHRLTEQELRDWSKKTIYVSWRKITPPYGITKKKS